MAENTKIEWADDTFNPWIGCTKVAPECKNCYAETRMDKRLKKVKWGPNGTRVVTSAANWKEPLRWNREAEKAGVKRRVFCASLADVFEDDCVAVCNRAGATFSVSLNDARGWLWDTIAQTPHLIWLLLTKRPENIRAMVPASWLTAWPANVWTGTSAGCQETADKNIPALLRVPGPHFLSCEPLLGPVVLRDEWLKKSGKMHMSISVDGALRNRAFKGWTDAGRPMSPKLVEQNLRLYQAKGIKLLPMDGCTNFDHEKGCMGHSQSRIDWVIVGGESGPGARPMDSAWARDLRDQCVGAGVAFHFKQWGEWFPRECWEDNPDLCLPDDCDAYTPSSTTVILENDMGEPVPMHRVGKARAGRVLDGRTWDEVPGAAGVGAEVA